MGPSPKLLVAFRVGTLWGRPVDNKDHISLKTNKPNSHTLNPVTRLIGTYPREVITNVLKGGGCSPFVFYEKIRAIFDINK